MNYKFQDIREVNRSLSLKDYVDHIFQMSKHGMKAVKNNSKKTGTEIVGNILVIW